MHRDESAEGSNSADYDYGIVLSVSAPRSLWSTDSSRAGSPTAGRTVAARVPGAPQTWRRAVGKPLALVLRARLANAAGGRASWRASSVARAEQARGQGPTGEGACSVAGGHSAASQHERACLLFLAGSDAPSSGIGTGQEGATTTNGGPSRSLSRVASIVATKNLGGLMSGGALAPGEAGESRGAASASRDVDRGAGAHAAQRGSWKPCAAPAQHASPSRCWPRGLLRCR